LSTRALEFLDEKQLKLRYDNLSGLLVGMPDHRLWLKHRDQDAQARLNQKKENRNPLHFKKCCSSNFFSAVSAFSGGVVAVAAEGAKLDQCSDHCFYQETFLLKRKKATLLLTHDYSSGLRHFSERKSSRFNGQQ
jgi:hypothetical protein